MSNHRVRVREASLSAEELADARRPRQAVVLERAVASDVFESVDGPVTSYRRTLEVGEPDSEGRYPVRQSLQLKVSIPYWGWVFALPLGLHLARLRKGDRLPVYFPPVRLDARAAATLARLGALAYALGYASTLLTQTITYAATEFGQGRAAQGFTLAAVRFDVLLSVPLAILADRRGRRFLVVGGTIAGCALTTLGALATNLATLTAAQVLARGFLSAAAVTLGVMVAEEMPASARAWATSMMVVAGAFGAGACVLLLPLADLRVWSWRLLYLVPLLGIPIARSAGRHLEETRRYVATTSRGVRASMRGHGRRFWLLAASAFLIALFSSPASQFQNEFLKNDRGYSAASITLFIFVTSVPAGLGILVGGRLAERSRKTVGAIAVLGGVGATVLMFNSAGWPILAWSLAGSLIGAAAVPALGVYGPELFPTGARGAANGVLGLLGRAGSVVGLVTTGYLADRIGLGRALTYLALGPLVLAILIITVYPETAHRELEEINPEDATGAAPDGG